MLQIEGNIGTMLPCNVVVQETADGRIEVAAIDPVASMMAVENPRLKQAAEQVREKLQRVVSRLWRLSRLASRHFRSTATVG